ncbi:hypothetical protein IAG41_13910 [Sphingomonas sp. JC676]|uniref:hypothetical protein n=1 Tax=Sphingomonas sp. JC676 TaxID=2768065 RepID=UPI0016577D72|nr:hypothetical protein [Sphingomonas sp. JC676]MBC9033487.1 hypothetical protein [Sphingomonas sp. JC676]
MRRLVLAVLPCVLLASPAAAQSQTEALINGQEPAGASDQLVSNATLEALNRNTEEALLRELDLRTRAELEAARQEHPMPDKRGWWQRLWDAIHDFDGPALWNLFVQPVPMLFVLAAILLLIWRTRRRG